MQMHARTRRIRRALGLALMASMVTTVFLLVFDGRWREAIPLHLCSLSAIAAAVLALRPRAALLDFLWYLGMPGAALALLFPAPAVSRCQVLMTASYMVTHLLILLIPAYVMILGMRPRCGVSALMLIELHAAALCAALANRALNTDFFFLAAPPAGTPLEAVFALGYPVYFCVLGLMMAALCAAMEKLARMFFAQNNE